MNGRGGATKGVLAATNGACPPASAPSIPHRALAGTGRGKAIAVHLRHPRVGSAASDGARTTQIKELIAAELALVKDGGFHALARQALALSGADTVWLKPDSLDIVRVGRRGGDPEVTRMLAALVPGRRAQAPDAPTGVFVHPLDSGAIVAFGYPDAQPGQAELAAAVATWVNLRLAQRTLGDESARAARAELRALRAQISPHFTFNAMGAIAALIRIDPDRAHALLLDFADYTRYSFGSHGEYTTFAEELRSTEIYLALERARFGDRLSVRVTVAPEVLTVPVPFLVLQPLVENAIRHGIEPLAHGGRVRVQAADEGATVRIEIEDDGAGMDPAKLEALLGSSPSDDPAARTHVGLRNIDERLRAVYGDAHGLMVDTARGAGTRVTLRIPKYRPDVRVG